MKKYLSLIAILALLVACMVPAVSADGAFSAYITSETVELGEGTATVELYVNTGDVAYCSGDFRGLTVSGDAKITNVKAANGFLAYNPNSGACAFIGTTDFTGTLLVITVEVPVSAPAVYTVSFTGTCKASGAQSAEQVITVAAGTITVNHTCVAGDWEIVKEATCTEDGLKVQKCTLCGEVLAEEVIKAAGHKLGDWEIVKEATCTEDGLKVKKCSVCGETVEEVVLEALGHDWDKGVIGNEGPYDCADEFLIFTCGRCEATKNEAHGHDCEKAKFTLDSWYDTEKKANYTTYQEKCVHSGTHGCSTVYGEAWTEEVVDPITGDITPYIAMGVLTMVSLVSAAAYLLLKRKAI